MEYGAILPVVFAAFFLKAMTGFGSAIVLVSIGSLFFPVQEVIMIGMMIEAFASIKLMKDDWQPKAHRYWVPLCATMVVGAIIGGLLLKVLAPTRLNVLLGIFIFCLGAWLFFKRRTIESTDNMPERPTRIGMVVTAIAGTMGGLLGISGPPIVWYFGQRLSRANFRMVVVPIFWCASIASLLTYLAVGLLTVKVALVGAMCIPVSLLALTLGSRVFNRIPEHRFGQVIGLILGAVAIKLLMS